MRIYGGMYLFGYVLSGLRIPVFVWFCIPANTGIRLDGYAVIRIQVCSGPPCFSRSENAVGGGRSCRQRILRPVNGCSCRLLLL